VIVLLGLDGEMSGSEIADGHVLVQIGAAFSATDMFRSLLGYPIGSYPFSEKGMAAHGIAPEEIAQAPSPPEVDAALTQYLLSGLIARGQEANAKRLIPVGFNVGAFDLPFVAKFLPNAYALLSRRVIDLNAFCLGYGAASKEYKGSIPKWSGWKRLAVDVAAKNLAAAGITLSPHDAGYDAAEALEVLNFLINA
jgi:hypothetical protein